MIRKLWVILTIFLSFGACSSSNDSNRDPDLLAEAYGEKLYRQDVKQALQGRELQADSAFLYEEYVQTWVKKKTLLHEALKALNSDSKDKEKQLEDYKNDLIMYEFEKLLLTKNLDLEISDLEVLSYYRNNQKNFELKENIVKLIFFKLPKSVKRIDRPI